MKGSRSFAQALADYRRRTGTAPSQPTSTPAGQGDYGGGAMRGVTPSPPRPGMNDAIKALIQSERDR